MAAERSTAASLRENMLRRMWGKFKHTQITHKQATIISAMWVESKSWPITLPWQLAARYLVRLWLCSTICRPSTCCTQQFRPAACCSKLSLTQKHPEAETLHHNKKNARPIIYRGFNMQLWQNLCRLLVWLISCIFTVCYYFLFHSGTKEKVS